MTASRVRVHRPFSEGQPAALCSQGPAPLPPRRCHGVLLPPVVVCGVLFCFALFLTQRLSFPPNSAALGHGVQRAQGDSLEPRRKIRNHGAAGTERGSGPRGPVGTSASCLSPNANRPFRGANANSGCGVHGPCQVSGPSGALGPLPPCPLPPSCLEGSCPEEHSWCWALSQSVLVNGKRLLETAGLLPGADSQRAESWNVLGAQRTELQAPCCGHRNRAALFLREQESARSPACVRGAETEGRKRVLERPGRGGTGSAERGPLLQFKKHPLIWCVVRAPANAREGGRAGGARAPRLVPCGCCDLPPQIETTGLTLRPQWSHAARTRGPNPQPGRPPWTLRDRGSLASRLPHVVQVGDDWTCFV